MYLHNTPNSFIYPKTKWQPEVKQRRQQNENLCFISQINNLNNKTKRRGKKCFLNDETSKNLHKSLSFGWLTVFFLSSSSNAFDFCFFFWFWVFFLFFHSVNTHWIYNLWSWERSNFNIKTYRIDRRARATHTDRTSKMGKKSENGQRTTITTTRHSESWSWRESIKLAEVIFIKAKYTYRSDTSRNYCYAIKSIGIERNERDRAPAQLSR